MKSASSFVRVLNDNWKLLASLHSESHGQSFSQQLFFKTHKLEDPHSFTLESSHHKLELLLREGLLEPVPRASKEYEFARMLLAFMESLLLEQKLTLHSELLVRIDALNAYREKLDKSLLDKDIVSYHTTCDEMDRLLRIIKEQVEDSMHAIDRLVEEAKLFPKTMPLKTRYAKTLDAWDSFVSPVLDMSKPDTPFSQTIRRIENALLGYMNDETLPAFLLESDYQRIPVIHGRLLDFQSVLQNAIENMGKKIYPIIQSVRLNTSVTRGATLALRTLERMKHREWVGRLGVGITKTRSVIRHGNVENIASFMMALKKNSLLEVEAPSLTSADLKDKDRRKKESRPLSQHDIIKEMKSLLPLDDAISAIHAKYPSIDLKMLIGCYSRLARTEGYKISRDDNITVEIEFPTQILSFKKRSLLRK